LARLNNSSLNPGVPICFLLCSDHRLEMSAITGRSLNN
jgi:hypothetical protein